MLRRKLAAALMLYAFLLPIVAFGQTAAAPQKIYTAPDDVIAKIKDEGMNKSQVMQTLSYLSDVIGARLTGSPALKRANEWTRDTMSKWGLKNAHLEAWGPFGRGWELERFSAQVIAPYDIPLIAYPKAWSPATNGVLNADVVYLDAKDDAALEKYKGQLKGKIVLISAPHEIKANFEPLGVRYSDTSLAEMAAFDPANPPKNNRRAGTPDQMQRRMESFISNAKRANFVIDEGAAMVVDSSPRGTGGTLFVQSANVAQDVPANPQEYFSRKRLQPYDKAAESKMIPQITLAAENYNRLVRMIQFGEKLQMSVNVQSKYVDNDDKAYNTIAEIPGTDPQLKDQVVMVGGHMDSWHSGTGATDNGAGVAVAMEAARIIQSLGLKPRRTIRVGLWTGEEEGLLGSRAYVKQHFGEMQGAQNQFGPPAPNAPKPTLMKGADYEKLDAYFNLDNGTGKIRGVYLQGNNAAAPIFERWLPPF
ncbi:MAG: M20/M25/M40 family metallo-hydrolase, partial [Pyrinomonadaceae bacterium]